jgi:hypothetical protein
MLGSQFHPEFLSRPDRPHPLFVGLMRAACERAGVEYDRNAVLPSYPSAEIGS